MSKFPRGGTELLGIYTIHPSKGQTTLLDKVLNYYQCTEYQKANWQLSR